MWHLLVQQAPRNFRFLEIGVFKGQTISLVSLLNKMMRKDGQVFAITPLNASGDKYATHPDVDYEEAIAIIYAQFGLDASDLIVIEGYSNHLDIIATARQTAPYDLIFIDGCHDYDVVVSDLTNYGDMVSIGGYLVIDDASNYLNIPDNLIRANWKGLEDVSRATRDVVENDARFMEVFAVGHNRIFKRIS
jgi:predicted O-methyltransferase YrrM